MAESKGKNEDTLAGLRSMLFDTLRQLKEGEEMRGGISCRAADVLAKAYANNPGSRFVHQGTASSNSSKVKKNKKWKKTEETE